MTAVGYNVVLRCEVIKKNEEKITSSGIYIPSKYNENVEGQLINKPTKDGKVRAKLFIESIGGGVDEKIFNFKVGDEVIVNDYDIQTQYGTDEVIYAICKAESIKAIV